MALSDVTCRTTKPSERLQKLSDGGGLQLWVQPNGAKLWRFAYRFSAKQKLLALGAYPLVTLASARDAAKRLLIDGEDPSEVRKEQRAEQAATGHTFKLIGAEYIEKLKLEKRSVRTVAKNEWLLEFAYPVIGARSITTVSPADILQILRNVETGGRFHSAHRLRSTIGSVFRLAIATGRAEVDPTIALRDALVSYKETPRPAITTEKLFGALLRAIDGYDGQYVTRCALQLMALLFPRPGELRQARWSEFDFDDAVWNVPAERMKGRRPHFVPLPKQAIALLRDLKEATGGDLVFPGVNRRRCISDATLNSALRRMGYNTKVDHCAHGFRSSASTLLNESGKWHRDAIERQLAHVEGNDVRRVYARGEYWSERVKLMGWWADECDRLRGGGSVLKLVHG
jgi:integrase